MPLNGFSTRSMARSRAGSQGALKVFRSEIDDKAKEASASSMSVKGFL